ncbi:MAG TPA: 16S rRNA (cytosine(1402)-N(4))-methyltransferase RsmH [Actinomycetales bacterium]|nr:16S rRNA (cytosine(1402)-N(4))-methyltransferase RsmH [Actinomycetales bacterium]
MENTLPHIPVLRDRCLELLAPALKSPTATVIDATLGAGGHSAALLSRFPELTVIGIDRDPTALSLARQRIEREVPSARGRFAAIHATYDEIPRALAQADKTGVEAVLFDLGVSSMQLDDSARGFSYSQAAPLDMRMDSGDKDLPTAADILARADERELVRIMRQYGEEKFAPHIARAIVAERKQEPITHSNQLVELIRATIPAAARRTGGNPAKRTFQALRIAVNRELDVLQRAIPEAINALVVGGRIVVMSYQSLEDRIVKRELAAGAEVSAPPDMPVVPESAQPYLRILTRGAERASESEIAENPRAKPVRLRAAQRIRNSPSYQSGGAR